MAIIKKTLDDLIFKDQSDSPFLLKEQVGNQSGILLSSYFDEEDEYQPVLFLHGNNEGERCRIANIRKPVNEADVCPKNYVDPVDIIFSGTIDDNNSTCSHTFSQIKQLVDAKRNVRFLYKHIISNNSYFMHVMSQIKYSYSNNELDEIEVFFSGSWENVPPTSFDDFICIKCFIDKNNNVTCMI